MNRVERILLTNSIHNTIALYIMPYSVISNYNFRQSKWPTSTQSTPAVPSSSELLSPRSRAAGGAIKRPQRAIPVAQKSFQKLLQMRQRSR